jgi:hypothetical protein
MGVMSENVIRIPAQSACPCVAPKGLLVEPQFVKLAPISLAITLEVPASEAANAILTSGFSAPHLDEQMTLVV